ncbi:MAG: GNAT family N-acetyltransferase [Candidatus Dormibacteria bacterium]
MLQPTYPIRTERLILRPFTSADADDLFAIYSRPDVVRYLYWEPRTRAQVAEDLERKLDQSVLMDEGQRLTLAVVLAGQRQVIGDVTLKWLSRDHRQGEVGFSFHPHQHGHGFATEAAAAMLDLGFRGLGLHRIIGRCDARNTPSLRVLERLGMHREAHFVHNEVFKGEWGDELYYAVREDEWRRP